MNVTDFFRDAALLGASWVMYLLVGLSVLSLSIVAERMIVFFRTHGNFVDFLTELQDRIAERESPARIAKWCSKKRLVEAKIAHSLLTRAMANPHLDRDDLTRMLITSTRIRLERGLVVLGTLGNNTPFVGLLGTIIGIINAFHALSVSTSAGPRVVMASVSEALVATAVGILVAIPAVVAYNFFMRAIRRRMSNSETVAGLLVSYLKGWDGKDDEMAEA